MKWCTFIKSVTIRWTNKLTSAFQSTGGPGPWGLDYIRKTLLRSAFVWVIAIMLSNSEKKTVFDRWHVLVINTVWKDLICGDVNEVLLLHQFSNLVITCSLYVLVLLCICVLWFIKQHWYSPDNQVIRVINCVYLFKQGRNNIILDIKTNIRS